MTQDEAEEVTQSIADLCADRGWSWKWRCTRGEQWHSEVKIEGPEGTRTVTKAWFSSTGHSAVGTLEAAVRYTLDHIAQKDQIAIDGAAYQERIANGGKWI